MIAVPDQRVRDALGALFDRHCAQPSDRFWSKVAPFGSDPDRRADLWADREKTNSFVAEMTGERDGDTGAPREEFIYSNGKQQSRKWVPKPARGKLTYTRHLQRQALYT